MISEELDPTAVTRAYSGTEDAEEEEEVETASGVASKPVERRGGSGGKRSVPARVSALLRRWRQRGSAATANTKDGGSGRSPNRAFELLAVPDDADGDNDDANGAESTQRPRLSAANGADDDDARRIQVARAAASALPRGTIRILHGTFRWRTDAASDLLHDITLEVNPGELVALVGQVGSGKSSIMAALLGEMYRETGEVTVVGRVAYVPQQAWIMNASVESNITFGRDMDPARYDAAVKACALLPDLAMLAAGDQTEIGEKGINLSGGQKQRVSLARATFADADVYLLDDPLSAVDAHVSRHLLDQVIGPRGTTAVRMEQCRRVVSNSPARGTPGFAALSRPPGGKGAVAGDALAALAAGVRPHLRDGGWAHRRVGELRRADGCA